MIPFGSHSLFPHPLSLWNIGCSSLDYIQCIPWMFPLFTLPQNTILDYHVFTMFLCGILVRSRCDIWCALIPPSTTHLLECQHNLQHRHGTTSGIAPRNTMHPSPSPHAGIMPLMLYLPFMPLRLMRPSWITHYAWCSLFFTQSIFFYIYDLPFIPYLRSHFCATKV